MDQRPQRKGRGMQGWGQRPPPNKLIPGTALGPGVPLWTQTFTRSPFYTRTWRRRSQAGRRALMSPAWFFPDQKGGTRSGLVLWTLGQPSPTSICRECRTLVRSQGSPLPLPILCSGHSSPFLPGTDPKATWGKPLHWLGERGWMSQDPSFPVCCGGDQLLNSEQLRQAGINTPIVRKRNQGPER